MSISHKRFGNRSELRFGSAAWHEVAAAVSMVLLIVGLLLPDRLAAPPLAAGLVALLALRLRARGSGPPRASVIADARRSFLPRAR